MLINARNGKFIDERERKWKGLENSIYPKYTSREKRRKTTRLGKKSTEWKTRKKEEKLGGVGEGKLWQEQTPHNASARGPRPRLIFCFAHSQNHPSGQFVNRSHSSTKIIEKMLEHLEKLPTPTANFPHSNFSKKNYPKLGTIREIFLPNTFPSNFLFYRIFQIFSIIS